MTADVPDFGGTYRFITIQPGAYVPRFRPLPHLTGRFLPHRHAQARSAAVPRGRGRCRERRPGRR